MDQGELPRKNLTVSTQQIKGAKFVVFLTSMSSPVFQGESFSAPMVPLLRKCHVFRENGILRAQPNGDVQSPVSIDASQTFVVAIGDAEPGITDGNAPDLGRLSDDLNFARLSAAVADWRAGRPSPEANTRVIITPLDGPLQSHDQVIRLLAKKVDRMHQGTLEGEQVKDAKDVDLAAEQHPALAPGMCAFESEVVGLRDAIATGGAKVNDDLVIIEWRANDSLGQAHAIFEVRNIVGRIGASCRVSPGFGGCCNAASKETAGGRSRWDETAGRSARAG
jgi:hypothetical protein